MHIELIQQVNEVFLGSFLKLKQKVKFLNSKCNNE